MFELAIAGLAVGGAYAALGVCVVLMYRMVGVLNFAIAAIGALGAFGMIMAFERGVPYVPATLVGVLVGGLLAVLLGLLMAWLFPSTDIVTRSTATIALEIGLLAVGFRVVGDKPHAVPDILPGLAFPLGGIVVPFASVLVLVGTIVLAVALTWFLRTTRMGMQLRALSQRPVTAELVGIPARRLTVLVWAFTGIVATLAIQVIMPSRPSDFLTLGLLVVSGLAAALLGVLRSFGLTVVGGLGLGVIESVATQFGEVARYRQAIPFLVILAVLIWLRRGEVWDEAR